MFRIIALLILSHSATLAQQFQAPLTLKVGWAAQALYLGDIDQDGHQDLALIDNARARLDLRFGLKDGENPTPSEQSPEKDQWEPLLENSPFQKRWITTGVTGYDLHFADLNQDGKLDALYTSDRNELTIHLQEKDRTWSQPEVLKLRSLKNNWTTLASADLDQDGDQDIVIICENDLAILTNLAGTLQPPQYYPCGENTYALAFTDLDQDGHLDISYQDSTLGKLYLRLQREGKFPVEQIISVTDPAMMVHYPQEAPQEIISLSTVTKAIERYQITTRQNNFETGEAAPFRYALGEAKAENLLHARADIDQDGDLDLLITDKKSAELRLYLRAPDGRFSLPIISPTVTGIEALAVKDIKKGGLLEAVIFSKDENIIGLIEFTPQGQASFPTEISSPEEPTALTAADLDRDGIAEIIYTSENALHLHRLHQGETPTQNLPLPDIGKGRLKELRPFDINQDGLTDLLLIPQRKPVKILLQQKDHTFLPADEQSGFAKKLMENVSPEALSHGDLDQDGLPELLLTRDSFIRGIRLGTSGQLEVTKQINIKAKDLALKASLSLNLLGSPTPEIIVFNQKDNSALICHPDGELISRIPLRLDKLAALTGDTQNLFLLGDTQFLRLPIGTPLLQATRTQDYQTTLKRVTYLDYRAGDLNGDGLDDIAVVDSRRSRVMEILLSGPDGFTSQQHFIIFKSDPHYRGKKGGDFQPEDFRIHDINGDGQNDLILHIHDRILTYLQAPPIKKKTTP